MGGVLWHTYIGGGIRWHFYFMGTVKITLVKFGVSRRERGGHYGGIGSVMWIFGDHWKKWWVWHMKVEGRSISPSDHYCLFVPVVVVYSE